jgi:hypothetical protein
VVVDSVLWFGTFFTGITEEERVGAKECDTGMKLYYI